MREKYESLSLATLKELAKARGLKGVSALRKPELIERMLHEDELENASKSQETMQEKPQQENISDSAGVNENSRSFSWAISNEFRIRISSVENPMIPPSKARSVPCPAHVGEF